MLFLNNVLLHFQLLMRILNIFIYRKGEWLTIPKGWLCYLAPEVIRSLRAGSRQENDNLPFSRASDIYAFGYEFHVTIFRKII